MTTTKISMQKVGLRYGIIGCVFMIIYFIVANLLNLENIEEVRFASNIFIVIAVVLAIGTYKRRHDGIMPYLPGLGLGFIVGLVSSVLYAAFIYLYATTLNPDYYQNLRAQDYFGATLSPVIVAASIVILGIAVGAMTGYTLMMLYDKSGGNTADKNI